MAYRKTKNPRCLVVDASIARAAGKSQHLYSRCGREVLTAILEVCHSAHFSAQLAQEWRNHRSRLSSIWLASMKAKKKYKREQIAQDTELRRRIAMCIETEERREAIKKDMHLVEAAFAYDRVVISYDEHARAALVEASNQYARIRLLAWVNPTKEKNVCEWLEAGADCTGTRLIG